jgi:hypothetical protein
LGGEATIDGPGERDGALPDLPGLERKDIVNKIYFLKRSTCETNGAYHSWRRFSM